MKKLTAMLLALCMLLAVVPALGADLSGGWYWVLEDVTVGEFQLNADGTATISVMAGSDSEQNHEGTWEATENGLTITVQGEPLEVAYDAEADTLTSSIVPIPMQREKGKYDMALIINALNGADVELPEGVTQADLVAVAAKFYASYMTLVSSGSDSGSDVPDTTEAEPAAPAASSGSGVDILAENFVVSESYSGYDGTYIAKIQNNTAAPLWVTDGNLMVKDASGALVTTKEYLSTSGSKYLEPGEISVITMQVDLAQDGEYTYERVINAKPTSYYSPDAAVTVADPVYGEGSYGSKLVKATVTNDTDHNLPEISVAFLLSDENGTPLLLTTESLYNRELCPNSSIVVISNLYSKAAEALAASGITPVVEAFAWVETK